MQEINALTSIKTFEIIKFSQNEYLKPFYLLNFTWEPVGRILRVHELCVQVEFRGSTETALLFCVAAAACCVRR